FRVYDPATTALSPLSLHDALPISAQKGAASSFVSNREQVFGDFLRQPLEGRGAEEGEGVSRVERGRSGAARVLEHVVGSFAGAGDRKSTRLNSSHDQISYAVFCLK